MKKLVLLIMVTLPFFSFCQNDSFLDERDKKSYPIKEIKETIWMLENLDYVTELSMELNQNQRALAPNLNGRWYHLDELKTACPTGWQLPRTEDWVNYFEYIAEQKEATFNLKTGKEHISINKFEDKIDLFEENNPLNLHPTGIFQGNRYISGVHPIMGNQADYWILDLPSRAQIKKNNVAEKAVFKPVRVLYEGKSHIHLFNKYTNIHSHDHHLEPNEEETLRRFMIRCVRYH